MGNNIYFNRIHKKQSIRKSVASISWQGKTQYRYAKNTRQKTFNM